MTNKYHIITNMGIKMAIPPPHKQRKTTTILSEADDGHATHNYNEKVSALNTEAQWVFTFNGSFLMIFIKFYGPHQDQLQYHWNGLCLLLRGY